MTQGDSVRIDGRGGRATYIMSDYNEQLAQEAALGGLSKKVEPTPDPSGDDEAEASNGGIVRRANEFRSNLGPVALESLSLHGMEISKANRRRADELYRNEFPRFEPAFTRKCTDCGTEFDEDVESCDECGAVTREPSQEQRMEAEDFFENVNKEGQSLRALYHFLATDGGRLGVWLHVVKKKYGVLRGEVFEEVQELVRGDPKRIKPVVDENGRIGGHWWACPVHRDTDDLAHESGQCNECGADLREVYYAEVERITDTDPVKVYFQDEVITHAPFTQRLGGHDGLSPAIHLWLKQAILEWMDLYGAGYYDQQNTNRYPGRMLILHTSNKNAVEKQLREAQDEKDEDPYAQGILYNEVPAGSDSATDSAQVLDLMNEEILGQSQDLKKDFKSDIRSYYGLTDAQDSELEDAGGLNNEGLQLEINDRDKASALQALRDGPLKKLMDVLGYTDWDLTFVPPEREEEEASTLDTIRAAAMAEQNGIAYEITDGRLEVVDTDGPVEPDPTPDQGDGGPGEDPPTDVQPPDVDVDQGADIDPRNADDTGSDYQARDEALQALEDGFKQLVWADVDTTRDTVEQEAREPFFADDDDMPEFVAELIEESLNSGAIHRGQYDAPNVTGQAVKDYLEEKLTQPQGWSLESLARDFADRWNLDVDTALETIRPQVANVLNKSREIGYERQGNLDERRFKWIGPGNPDDGVTTDACVWLKQQTNPKYGGEPVTLDQMKALIAEAQERWFPDYDGHEMAVHWNERHTFVEHFDRPN